jgi:hypothetical protein
MNIDHLRQKLLGAVRANPPSDAVPYAFEKRIMARVAELPAVDVWSVWNRVLWKAAAPCVALTLLLGCWTLVSLSVNGGSHNLPDELENALMTPADNPGEAW